MSIRDYAPYMLAVFFIGYRPQTRNEWGLVRDSPPYHKGAKLFTSVRWFELSQLMRCEDPVHTAFVEDRYRGKRVSSIKVLEQYKRLTKEDMQLKEWIDASALVSTNRERCSLTHVRSIQYAAFHGKVVTELGRRRLLPIQYKRQHFQKRGEGKTGPLV